MAFSHSVERRRGNWLKYSVVVPARNAAGFLSTALASIHAQTLQPEAIIVVDDGSSDATAEIAASCGAVVISNQTARGPSAARNIGVYATSTELIAFLDADDEWTPEHAALTVAQHSREGVVFSAGRAVLFGSESCQVPVIYDGVELVDLRDALVVENPVIQSGVVINRIAFYKAGGYDESMRLAEDYDLWWRVAEVGLFAPVVSTTVRRRIHAEQASSLLPSGMVGAAWLVRRRATLRAWSSFDEKQRSNRVDLLCRAARLDLKWAVWTGVPAMLSLVRNELMETDRALGLQGRLANLGGASRFVTKITQDFCCRAYGVRDHLRAKASG